MDPAMAPEACPALRAKASWNSPGYWAFNTPTALPGAQNHPKRSVLQLAAPVRPVGKMRTAFAGDISQQSHEHSAQAGGTRGTYDT